ncbi:MAG TPA: hypothetical protein VF691_22520 [Cytophagaceae bacterium]
MSKLNQYIGGIVSSITNARSIGDMQTIELAKQYAGHDLLKHFSVPRMRIADIEMTIPVAMDTPNPGSFEMFDEPRLNNAVIDAAAKFIGIKEPGFREKSYPAISEMTKSILKNSINEQPDTNERIRTYSERVANYFVKTEIGLIKESNVRSRYRREELAPQLIQVVTNTLASDTALLGDTNVIIEASKLRDIPRENITYIKMKIREDGMEWAVSENKEGEVESKLLPE